MRQLTDLRWGIYGCFLGHFVFGHLNPNTNHIKTKGAKTKSFLLDRAGTDSQHLDPANYAAADSSGRRRADGKKRRGDQMKKDKQGKQSKGEFDESR